jgi:diacylglycerol kinase family enzyme
LQVEGSPGGGERERVRAAVLVNDSAGLASSGEVTEELVREALRAAGVDAAVEIVAGERLEARARAALSAGADAVVAGGGDGTISTVADVLAGSDTPLGVLPLGTLNHFARHLGIPVDLEAAARTIGAGHVRVLDVGEVNGHVFVNNSLLGFYPPVVQERDRQRRRQGRGKWVAAVSALVKVLPRVPALDLALEVEGRRLHRTTRFVFIGNSEYEMSLFAPGERHGLDSGELYLYIVRHESRLTLARLALLALVRDATRSDAFESWCVPTFTIEERDRPSRKIPVFLDGEVFRLQPPLVYRSRPRELRVLAPAPGKKGEPVSSPRGTSHPELMEQGKEWRLRRTRKNLL